MIRPNLGNFHQARISLTVLAIVTVTGILIFLIVLPQIRAVNEIKKDIDLNKRQIAAIQNKVKSYQEVHNTFKQITGSDEVPQIFPKREDMVALIEGLERSVTLTGGTQALSLTDSDSQQLPNGKKVEVEPVVKGPTKVREIPYTIQYYGDFRQTVDLLSYMENLPFVTYITQLSLGAEAQKGEGLEAERNSGFAFTQIDGVLFIKK